jgi:excinuclease UvrABC ATPase subunit
MSVTLDDKAVDVFKLYDEMTAAYSYDIEGYKTLLKAIEALIAQKDKMLRDIKDKTVDLVKTSLEITAVQKTTVRKKRKKLKYAGVDVVEALISEKDIEPGEVVELQSLVVIPPKKEQVKRTISARQKKATEKGKAKRAVKSNEPVKQSENKTKPTNDVAELKCLYHPESPALDKGRQLCSSCKWKLKYSGLLNFDNDPAVVAFLKGETLEIPNMGQSMCPIHPAVASYNQKTGLCQACQKKAKAIGVEDRHLTKKELTVLRNTSIKM